MLLKSWYEPRSSAWATGVRWRCALIMLPAMERPDGLQRPGQHDLNTNAQQQERGHARYGIGALSSDKRAMLPGVVYAFRIVWRWLSRR